MEFDLSESGEADEIPLACVQIRQEAQGVKTYVFAPTLPARVHFSPGQFLNLTFSVDGEEHVRSYSISSSAAVRDRIAITVKRVRGGKISNWLYDHLTVGQQVRASGPLGVFTHEDPNRPLLLLTAGTGVTPAASMMRSFSDHGSEADVVLLHFARRPEELIFREEMAVWARNMPNAKVVPIVTQPAPSSGWVGPVARLSRELLAGLVPNIGGRRVYCCGPEAFMASAREQLLKLGVASEDFVQESFYTAAVEEPLYGGEDPGTGEDLAAHRIDFVRSGKESTAAIDSTVLAAAGQAGVRIQTSCREGICGTCRVKLISGTVEMRHQGGIKPREIERGFILACCSRPTSDLEVDA